MSFAILGLGTAVPETIILQTEALEVTRALCCRTAEQETWLPTMYVRTGIDERRIVLGADVRDDVLHGTCHSSSPFLPTGAVDDCGPTTAERMEHYRAAAGPLALEAARRALADSEVDAGELTHLVTVSCTGFHAPGVDWELIDGLGLSPAIARTNVGYMGCHGALNGLRVAAAFAAADPSARVLLCAVELCSLHYHYGWEPQKMVANAIFGDGAAALIGGRATTSDWQHCASESCVFPSSRDAMSWSVGDHGFEMTLSRKVPELIQRNLRPWLTAWLARHELTLDAVGSWAIHPGGPKILDAVESALDLPPEATVAAREVFASQGNMSSPTVLFILDLLRRTGAARPCVALGFGPGLAVEAALFQ